MIPYRNSTQIVSEIVTLVQNSGQVGIQVTPLCQKSNLSHSRLRNFLTTLTGSKDKGFSIYRIQFDESFTKIKLIKKYFIGDRIRDIIYDEKRNLFILSLENIPSYPQENEF